MIYEFTCNACGTAFEWQTAMCNYNITPPCLKCSSKEVSKAYRTAPYATVPNKQKNAVYENSIKAQESKYEPKKTGVRVTGGGHVSLARGWMQGVDTGVFVGADSTATVNNVAVRNVGTAVEAVDGGEAKIDYMHISQD